MMDTVYEASQLERRAMTTASPINCPSPRSASARGIARTSVTSSARGIYRQARTNAPDSRAHRWRLIAGYRLDATGKVDGVHNAFALPRPVKSTKRGRISKPEGRSRR